MEGFLRHVGENAGQRANQMLTALNPVGSETRLEAFPLMIGLFSRITMACRYDLMLAQRIARALIVNGSFATADAEEREVMDHLSALAVVGGRRRPNLRTRDHVYALHPQYRSLAEQIGQTFGIVPQRVGNDDEDDGSADGHPRRER